MTRTGGGRCPVVLLRCSAKILILEGVDRCTEYESFKRIDAAFKAGELAALQAAVDDPDSIPNGCLHPAIFESCLVYAIYHSPVAFIRTLLELGADPRPSDHMGFPPLIAALSRSRPVPGAPARPDVITVTELLLEFQADPNQRGINDYTALHMAVSEGNVEAVQVLLDAGADPTCRTRIDDCETPLEMAQRANLAGIATLLSR